MLYYMYYLIKSRGGGSLEVLGGGEASPLSPPLDETLCINTDLGTALTYLIARFGFELCSQF